MVYYGALSRGCERCRQRKVKCDQRKPSCLRCEKSKAPCPGFRDLTEVAFRDEAPRIIGHVQRLHQTAEVEPRTGPERTTVRSVPGPDAPGPLPTEIRRSLCQPLGELGANFFFTNYSSCRATAHAEGCHAWLVRTYSSGSPNNPIRSIIEATGMVGISNVYDAPDVAAKARAQYGRVLSATSRSLKDTTQSTTDSTLMMVLLLGLFEFVSFDSWDRYRSWTAHMAGATALLELRGRDQFKSDLAGSLFVQLRSQILYACMQLETTVPETIVRISDAFGPSSGRCCQNNPGPLKNICFRLLSLRAAIKNGEMPDPVIIYDTAAQIDKDLQAWTHPLHSSSKFTTVEGAGSTCFNGKRHVYSSVAVSQAWNNWRALRILVNQIILRHPTSESEFEPLVLLINNLSADICTSTPSFSGSPLSVGLIWPLSVVAQESLNPYMTRKWAVSQLQRINSSMGFRQAGLIADPIAQSLSRGVV